METFLLDVVQIFDSNFPAEVNILDFGHVERLIKLR